MSSILFPWNLNSIECYRQDYIHFTCILSVEKNFFELKPIEFLTRVYSKKEPVLRTDSHVLKWL
jgi:hypothetical protein